MAVYMVGYDLIRPNQDYEDLSKRIKNLVTWWHCLDSTWLIIHPGPATAIRDELAPYIVGRDEILVVGLTHEAAWQGFGNSCSEWLKKNL